MNRFDPNQHWQPSVLPWHRAAFHRLLESHQHNRLPHALLLTGGRGSGKTVFAGALAAALLCRSPESGPCEQCEGCQMGRGGAHGDFRWLEAEEGKRAIGIDSVRSAIHFVQQTAGYGDSKVLVVSPAESMTTAAANALLKTLEEPAGNSLIILISHRPGDLPATIRSRCQQVPLPPPSVAEGVTWLASQFEQQSAEDLRAALDASGLRVLSAWDMIESGTTDQATGLRTVLLGLFRGNLTASQGAAELADYETEWILETASEVLAQEIRHLGVEGLRTHQALFPLDDQIREWLAAIRRGLNLGRDLLLSEFCQRIAGSLRA